MIREAGVLPRLLVCLTDIDNKVRNLAAITMFILHNSDSSQEVTSATTVGAALAKALSLVA